MDRAPEGPLRQGRYKSRLTEHDRDDPKGGVGKVDKRSDGDVYLIGWACQARVHHLHYHRDIGHCSKAVCLTPKQLKVSSAPHSGHRAYSHKADKE